MKKFFITLLFLFFGAVSVWGQNGAISDYVAGLSSLSGSSSAVVTVTEDPVVQRALAGLKPATGRTSGMNICIFFDNGQNARSGAYGAAGRMSGTFGGVPTWVVYQNPFFKAMAGYCMDKLEAAQLLGMVKPMFPSAVIVKSSIPLRSLMRKMGTIEYEGDVQLPADANGASVTGGDNGIGELSVGDEYF